MNTQQASLMLEDGTMFTGMPFGAEHPTAGEVVFTTGMVGYTEAMTDPSYAGQLLVFTYPLIGNYGVPMDGAFTSSFFAKGEPHHFESQNIQVRGIIVSNLSFTYSHWSALDSLHSWMRKNKIPGLYGVDTRLITKKLRTEGSMLGKLLVAGAGDVPLEDPNTRNLAAEASAGAREWHLARRGNRRVAVVDLGCKHSIIRRLLDRDIDVLKVPWDFDWTEEKEIDGVVISNGPGDPKRCTETIRIVRKGLAGSLPLLGICLGHQIIALAAGGDTYKLKYGHRGQNQPCIEEGTRRCYITTQNHGYAVDVSSLGPEWKLWFTNANDGTNEGIRHVSKPVFAVQFHPEASPGPVDTEFVFDLFAQSLEHVHETEDRSYSR